MVKHARSALGKKRIYTYTLIHYYGEKSRMEDELVDNNFEPFHGALSVYFCRCNYESISAEAVGTRSTNRDGKSMLLEESSMSPNGDLIQIIFYPFSCCHGTDNNLFPLPPSKFQPPP